jgi:F-type H+-transporting ATPase subunit gamma
VSAVKDLRVRIANVETIAKITKTLSLVASSALTKCRRLLYGSEAKLRVLEEPLKELLEKLQSKRLNLSEEESAHKKLVIVIGSERGFCGSFNAKVIKALNSIPQEVKLIALGKKMFSKLQSSSALKLNLPLSLEAIPDLAFYLAQKILDEATAEPTLCAVVYSKFKSIVAADVEMVDLIESQFFLNTFSEAHRRLGRKVDDDLFPSKVYQVYLQSMLHFAMLSSRAAEEAARVVAMDNAAKDSKELAADLTIKMNKIRQENITRELIEILTGAHGAQ